MLARIYANALFRATAMTSGKALDARLVSFGKLLARKGHEKLARSIMREYAKVALREKQRNEVRISVAHEKETAAAKKQLANIDGGAAAREIVVSVDPALVRGYRIEGNDILFDGNARRKLADLYQKLIA